MKGFLLLFIYFSLLIENQGQTNDIRKGKLYLSWGYNKEWYSKSDIKVIQPELGNHFIFTEVQGKDKPGWNTGIFNKPLTIPQYNYRLGYFLTNHWLFELNFDHTKFIVPNQKLHLKGLINNFKVDTFLDRNDQVLAYQLNNGANFFLFNIGYRCNVSRLSNKYFNNSILLKGGAGFLYPHVQNTILGNENVPDFQYGGLDVGIEGVWRTTLYKNIYMEYALKALYADYNQLKIYKGRASQKFSCFEMILNLGIEIPTIAN